LKFKCQIKAVFSEGGYLIVRINKMNKTIWPSYVEGEIRAPASKSFMQRAVVAGLLSDGSTRLIYPSYCDDSLAALRISEQLGATVTRKTNEVIIKGEFKPRSEVLNCGESGLGIRMFSSVAALHHSELFLTGVGSLEKRPLFMIEKPLRDLGVKCETKKGFIPVRVNGPLTGGKTTIDGSVSSQFLTGLLMALPVVKQDSEIKVINLKSKPYIDLTIKVLSDFGIVVDNQNYEVFKIKGNQTYIATEYEIEGDWSNAAFLLVAGALTGSVTVSGLKMDSKQGDKSILDVLKNAGASVETSDEYVRVTRKDLNSFEFDATECPDLFPPLVALSAHCKGKTYIKGANRLLGKESNRASALKNEFQKLGVEIQLNGDEMVINGGEVNSGSIYSNNDHRITMAAAIIALKARGSIVAINSECVTKSYPNFFHDFLAIGGIAYE
jgi:3-phosphoshikimate 1-carboxyvinyltransferase